MIGLGVSSAAWRQRPTAKAADPAPLLARADILITPDSAFTGTEAAVTGLNAGGALALPMSAIGSGAEITKEANGWRFNAGRYLRWLGAEATEYPSAIVVLDYTIHSAPGNAPTVFLLEFDTASRLLIRYTSTPRLQLLGASNDSMTDLTTAAYGGRGRLAVVMDGEGQQLPAGSQAIIGNDGQLVPDATVTARAPIQLDQITMGAADADLTLHNVAVWLWPAGETFDAPFIDYWSAL